MPMPRLLPLLAVAACGVLAINAIENGPGIVGAARSFAEGVAPKANAASPLPPTASAIAAAPGQVAAQAVAAKPAPICAESPAELAKEAGLSPAELQVIQSLGARRGELDQREQGLSTELAVIQAAEAKVDARIATMNGLKADMQTMLGQLDEKQQAEVNRLVKVYADMKPQAAAARFTLLTDEVRLPIAAAMKEQKLSAIIANMAPPDAKHLTEALAARYVAQAAAARAAISPPAAPAAAQPAAAKPAPAQATAAQAAAQAPAQAAPAVVTGARPARKPAVHRKPRVARAPARSVAAARPPVKTAAAAKPPEPVWPPKPAAGAAAPVAAGARAAAGAPAAKAAAANPPAAKSAAAAPAAKPAASPPARPATKSASGAPATTPAKTG